MQSPKVDLPYTSLDDEFKKFLSVLDDEHSFTDSNIEQIKNIFVAGVASGFLFAVKALDTCNPETTMKLFTARQSELNAYMKNIKDIV